jgi:hypothetical protein
MRLFHLAYVLGLAAVTGLGSAWAVLGEHVPFNLVTVGPWTAAPRATAVDADPYARAIMAKRAYLPLGVGEGLAFSALTDSTGQRLDSACDYRIEGVVPAARGWSLSLARPGGPLAPGPADRISFTHAELTRGETGMIDIRLSRQVQPGDWLPLPDIGAMRLVLRLYDTPVSGTASELKPRDLPLIRLVGCA